MTKTEIADVLHDLKLQVEAIDLRGHRRDTDVQLAVGDAWEGLDSAVARLDEAARRSA